AEHAAKAPLRRIGHAPVHLDHGVDGLRLARRDREPDPSHLVGRQPVLEGGVGEPLPRLAAVRGLVDPTPRAHALHVGVAAVPPSVYSEAPAPHHGERGLWCSPAPTHPTFVSEGAMATSPMVWTPRPSETDCQVMPPFEVFQTPPPAAPT